MTSKHISNYLELQVMDIQKLKTLHVDVQDIAKMACIAWKLAPSKFYALNEMRILDITMHSPILCVEVKSKLYVIGGFRTWNIVMVYYQNNNKPSHVPVLIIKRQMNKKKRKEIAKSSLLLSLISQSLGMHASNHIGDIWISKEILASDLYEHFFEHRASTKSRLPRAFDQSYEAFYPKEKTQ
ncbi:MAG: hypothetical protein Q9M17_03425 [Mariprofundus sp.]|nr:hypothetical protein [Mariprofundus sp.]